MCFLLQLEYPLVIKRNRGCQGHNVFLCQNQEEMITAIRTVFDKRTPWYDFVVLAQEYIPTQSEYRLVCFRRKPVFAYERYAEGVDFKVEYWETGKVIPITDEDRLNELHSVIKSTFPALDVGFGGFDISYGHDDNQYLLEINARPLFDHFAEECGNETVITMYHNILKEVFDC